MLKLQSRKRKVGDLLRKEKVEKKLQVELLVIDSQADKGASAQKLLTEKKIAIQLLKRKMKIPFTELIQTSKIMEFEKEKEALTTKFIDFKVRLLKFEEKEKQWEKYGRIWAENEKA